MTNHRIIPVSIVPQSPDAQRGNTRNHFFKAVFDFLGFPFCPLKFRIFTATEHYISTIGLENLMRSILMADRVQPSGLYEVKLALRALGAFPSLPPQPHTLWPQTCITHLSRPAARRGAQERAAMARLPLATCLRHPRLPPTRAAPLNGSRAGRIYHAAPPISCFAGAPRAPPDRCRKVRRGAA